MESAAKRLTGENDRISALPDELRVNILGFLPTLDAVRTTVLSTQWKDLWTSVSNLDFDDHRDFSDAQTHYHYYTDRFTTFVERVLMLRDSKNICKFHLAVHKPDDVYCSRIESWICTVAKRNVSELYLDLHDGWYFHIPQSMFMCKTLKVLKVGTTVVCTYHPSPYASFPSRNFLTNDGDKQKHGCYSPFVEDLTVIPVAIYEDEDFNVYAPKLKTLRISLERVEWHHFLIYAPELKTFCLEEVSLSTLTLECPDSLVEATIKFRHLNTDEEPRFADSATALMAAIFNVQTLVISAYCFEARYLPVFQKLTKLKLDLHVSDYCLLLPELLGKTPNLNDLALEDRTKYDASSELRWVSPIVTPLCLRSHLKIVSIKGFKGRQADKDAYKYLRSHGLVLQEMIVYFGRRRIGWKKRDKKEDKGAAEEYGV